MTTGQKFFSLHLNETTFTFKVEDLPLTLDNTSRNFFTSFIETTNASFTDIRKFYLDQKHSNMSSWCCLLGCTIVGIIPCCFWMSKNSSQNREWNTKLEKQLAFCLTNLMNSLQDFNGLAELKKDTQKNPDNAYNWNYYFDIRCDSMDKQSVPYQGIQDVPMGGSNTNKINIELDMGMLTNKDMMGPGYSNEVTNLNQGLNNLFNNPPGNNFINNQMSPIMDVPSQGS